MSHIKNATVQHIARAFDLYPRDVIDRLYPQDDDITNTTVVANPDDAFVRLASGQNITTVVLAARSLGVEVFYSSTADDWHGNLDAICADTGISHRDLRSWSKLEDPNAEVLNDDQFQLAWPKIKAAINARYIVIDDS